MKALVSEREAVREHILQSPPAGGSIWPRQRCPVFALRKEGLGCVRECWFCRYANFHLHERVALEVGVCCWPNAQME